MFERKLKEPKTDKMACHLPFEMGKRIRSLAKKHGVPITQIVVEVLELGFGQLKGKKSK